jgi:hypothetical protein
LLRSFISVSPKGSVDLASTHSFNIRPCCWYLFVFFAHHIRYIRPVISINSARHASRTPLLCRKLVCVTGHRDQCRTGPTCDNAKRPKISLKTDVLANFGSCCLLPHPIGCKYSPKLPIWALFKLLSVEILALSRSLATCVEVSN